MFQKFYTFIFVFLFPVMAWSQTAVIKGNVSDETGVHIPGAAVVLSGTLMNAFTDSSGAYEIQNVPYGDYTLQVKAAGYIDFTLGLNVSKPEISVSNIFVSHEDRSLTGD